MCKQCMIINSGAMRNVIDFSDSNMSGFVVIILKELGSDWYYLYPSKEYTTFGQFSTVKPVYNDHLMGYFSALWSSSRAT